MTTILSHQRVKGNEPVGLPVHLSEKELRSQGSDQERRKKGHIPPGTKLDPR